MEDNDFSYVRCKMDNEGFHYCFTKYSDFEEIKDEKFHELRLKFVNAANELEVYINKKAGEEAWDEDKEDNDF